MNCVQCGPYSHGKGFVDIKLGLFCLLMPTVAAHQPAEHIRNFQKKKLFYDHTGHPALWLKCILKIEAARCEGTY